MLLSVGFAHTLGEDEEHVERCDSLGVARLDNVLSTTSVQGISEAKSIAFASRAD